MFLLSDKMVHELEDDSYTELIPFISDIVSLPLLTLVDR